MGRDQSPDGHTSGRRVGRPRSPACDEAILDAALSLLGRDGFARMRMDAVAAEAGVSKATLYLRYRNKADVATAALARLRRSTEPAPTGDLRADLIARLAVVTDYAEMPSVVPLVGTCLSEERRTPELLDLLRQRSVMPRRASLRAILKDAQGRGEVAPEATIEAAIDLIMGSFLARHLAGDGFSPEWPAQVVDLVLQGLRVRSAVAESDGDGPVAGGVD